MELPGKGSLQAFAICGETKTSSARALRKGQLMNPIWIGRALLVEECCLPMRSFSMLLQGG
jgi:hypothetical protein